MPIRPDLKDLAALWVLFLGEILIIAARLDFATSVLFHLALVQAIGIAGIARRSTLVQTIALITVVTGPFGAVVGVTVGTGLRIFARDPSEHASWYQLLSGASLEAPPRRLVEDLRAGRIGAFRHPPRRTLVEVFTEGSRAEKQAALRWIVQKGVSDFEAVLRLALNDDDNTIRVEAAALMGRQSDPVEPHATKFAKAAE